MVDDSFVIEMDLSDDDEVLCFAVNLINLGGRRHALGGGQPGFDGNQPTQVASGTVTLGVSRAALERITSCLSHVTKHCRRYCACIKKNNKIKNRYCAPML